LVEFEGRLRKCYGGLLAYAIPPAKRWAIFDRKSKGRRRDNRNGFGMAKELAEVCTKMVRYGEDFPTVWVTYLKNHALVIGLPESKLECRRPITEIKLVTGELLVFDGDARRFLVK
jgi:hypothetical protein